MSTDSDGKVRQMAELEVHFHRWTLHELGLPAVVVRYVELVMRKRLMMALGMTAEDLQDARMLHTGPWNADTKAFIGETFTEDDWADVRGLDEALQGAGR